MWLVEMTPANRDELAAEIEAWARGAEDCRWAGRSRRVSSWPMKLFLFVFALIAILTGSLLLLPLLAWASLQNPSLGGAAVLATLLGNRAGLAGVAVVVLGVVAGL